MNDDREGSNNVIVKIPPDIEPWIRQRVASGEYSSEADVVQAALFRMREESADQVEGPAELKAMVNAGVAQLDRGESEEFDPAKMKAEARQYRASLGKKV